MLTAATVVTIYASPLIPILMGLAVAWVALVAGLVAEVRNGRRAPGGSRTNVLVVLAAVLAAVSAFLAYGAFLIVRP